MSQIQVKVAADKQIELLAAASFAIGYLDAFLKDSRGALPVERRDDLANLVTRLELAREAVTATQKAECAA